MNRKLKLKLIFIINNYKSLYIMGIFIVEKARTVNGEVNLSGSKNAALPIIVAACLTEEKVTLYNVPLELNDVHILINLLNCIGFNIKKKNDDTLEFCNNNNIHHEVPEEADKIRISLLFLSLLLSKIGKVKLPLPGGCDIGLREYDIHLDSLCKMGASIREEGGYIIGELDGKFKGKDLTFHTATTTGSENVIIAATLSEGYTIIRNANTRPEVIDLMNFLTVIGAKIKYHTRFIEIEGVNRLKGGEYRIINGRDEALTYMILAGIMRGEIKINNFTIDLIKTDVNLLREIGLDIFEWGNNIYISAKDKELKPFSMATSPYPGINSDMQPLYGALAASIEGESIITDMRFKDRFQYVNEFKKFGIDINNYSNYVIINGKKTIKGANVIATDLRCGAALILLGCLAENKTIIENSYQLDRGYMNIVLKLNSLGCNIRKNK